MPVAARRTAQLCPDPGLVTLANLQGGGIPLSTLPGGGTITFTLTGTYTLSSGVLVNTAIATPLNGSGVTAVTAQASVSGQPQQIPALRWNALIALMLVLATLGAMSVFKKRD